jgi:hypothetical protein
VFKGEQAFRQQLQRLLLLLLNVGWLLRGRHLLLLLLLVGWLLRGQHLLLLLLQQQLV